MHAGVHVRTIGLRAHRACASTAPTARGLNSKSMPPRIIQQWRVPHPSVLKLYWYAHLCLHSNPTSVPAQRPFFSAYPFLQTVKELINSVNNEYTEVSNRESL